MHEYFPLMCTIIIIIYFADILLSRSCLVSVIIYPLATDIVYYYRRIRLKYTDKQQHPIHEVLNIRIHVFKYLIYVFSYYKYQIFLFALPLYYNIFVVYDFQLFLKQYFKMVRVVQSSQLKLIPLIVIISDFFIIIHKIIFIKIQYGTLLTQITAID